MAFLILVEILEPLERCHYFFHIQCIVNVHFIKIDSVTGDYIYVRDGNGFSVDCGSSK